MPRREKQSRAFNRLLGGNASSPPEKRAKKSSKPSTPRELVDHYDSTLNSDEDDTDLASSSSLSSLSSQESIGYFPGFLDDPMMVQGRNRTVMLGDKVTGPIISSTIQFVQPSVLKADLNKQFRERFDQWEPPKAQRKYIGARVLDGVYALIDPTEVVRAEDVDDEEGRHLSESMVGLDVERATLRMPPSLTLSKIRR